MPMLRKACLAKGGLHLQGNQSFVVNDKDQRFVHLRHDLHVTRVVFRP